MVAKVGFASSISPSCGYLVTVFDPDSGSLAGPYKIDSVFDGINDYPRQSGAQQRQTLCNSNFRFSSTGALAIDAAGALYFTFSDNRKHAGEFPFPTTVSSRTSPYTEASYSCPAGKVTDNDVFVWKSTDGGANWTDVTPASATASHDQFSPFIAAGPAGRVSVVFYDRSASATNKQAATRVATSGDSGGTWTTTTVSDFQSNFDFAFVGDGSFIGDYTGIAVDAAGFSHPVWAGVTPGKQDSDIFKGLVAP